MTSPTLLLDPPRVSAPATFEAIVVNRGDTGISYGLAFRIEYWDGDHWQKTDIAPDVFPLIAILVAPGEISGPDSVEIPADIEPGFYRVVKENITEDDTGTSFTVTALFQVCGAAQPAEAS